MQTILAVTHPFSPSYVKLSLRQQNPPMNIFVEVTAYEKIFNLVWKLQNQGLSHILF